MGKIIATCCHEITSKWMSDERSRIHLKTSDTHGNPAVSFEVVCPECRDSHEEGGRLLESEKEIDNYLGLVYRLWKVKPSISKDKNGVPIIDLGWGEDDDAVGISMSTRDAREMAREIMMITEAHTSLS